jgi:hypothetical protein
MPRTLLLLMLIVAGCSKGPQADLQYISDARSLAAEWALVNEQAALGKLNATYVGSMHEWIGQQLQTDMSSISETQSDYAAEMQALAQLSPDASPGELRKHAATLKQIEDKLESA